MDMKGWFARVVQRSASPQDLGALQNHRHFGSTTTHHATTLFAKVTERRFSQTKYTTILSIF
jgi:hypothetical protein